MNELSLQVTSTIAQYDKVVYSRKYALFYNTISSSGNGSTSIALYDLSQGFFLKSIPLKLKSCVSCVCAATHAEGDVEMQRWLWFMTHFIIHN